MNEEMIDWKSGTENSKIKDEKVVESAIVEMPNMFVLFEKLIITFVYLIFKKLFQN